MKRIDIVDIKQAVKEGMIEFIAVDDYIYCRDVQSKETVIVGEVTNDEAG